MVCLMIYLNLYKKEDLDSRWPGRSCRCQNNKLKSCRFVEIKSGLSLSQIVKLSAVGVLEQDCRYIFLPFWSDVTCRQNHLEGLFYDCNGEIIFVSDKIRAKMPQKPNFDSKKIRTLGENGINSKLKHRKAHNSILSWRFADSYGRRLLSYPGELACMIITLDN